MNIYFILPVIGSILFPSVLVYGTTSQLLNNHADSMNNLLNKHWKISPDQYNERLKELKAQFLSPARKEDEPCPSTPLNDWAMREFEAIGNETLSLLSYYQVFELATYYGVHFRKTSDLNEYFYHDGSRTNEFKALHRNVKAFWDIPSNDIVLLGAHGRQLDDIGVLTDIYTVLTDLDTLANVTDESPKKTALFVHNLINTTIGFDHPLLSLNAFAASPKEDQFDDDAIDDKFISQYKKLLDRIVIGEGLLEVFDILGYGATTPGYIYAHEFGHHIQFERDLLGINATLNESNPFDLRELELMTDAFAGYYLAHPKGGNFKKGMVHQLWKEAFVIGDCEFNATENTNSHGTPNQRKRAIMFGTTTAKTFKSKTKARGSKLISISSILPSTAFIKFFYKALPDIIEPSATQKSKSKGSSTKKQGGHHN